MEQSRRISKLVEQSLYDYYSYGALVPHRFPLRRVPADIGYTYVDIPMDPLPDDSDELVEEHSGTPADVREYWSTPDVEGIISATNLLQSDYGLNDFMQQFKGYMYKDGDKSVSIKRAKITYPHVYNVRNHNIPAPHPSMTDDELKKYVWPMSYLNRENRSYVASLWIDIGDTVEEFIDEDEDGMYGSSILTESLWRRVMDIPIQVGSNRCNLSIMRSYIDDETYDHVHQMTWGTRARQFLDSMRWEPLLPDGYFIIKGKMKRVNITDKLMMNMSYVVKQSTTAEYGSKRMIPMRERAVEVRSVKTELGLAYMRILLVPPGKDELRPGKGMDNELFKFYNSTIKVMIDKEFPEPINIFDLVRGYGVIVLGMEDTNTPMNDLLDHIRRYSSNDKEVMRMASVSLYKAGVQDVQSVVNVFRYMMIPAANQSVDDRDSSNQDLSDKMRKKVLPHCDTDDLEESYMSKIRFIAMMIVDLVLSTTVKHGTTTYRRDPTDRKDFAYKRWESAGHRIRDHIRSMLVARTQFKGKEMYYGTINIASMDKAANQLVDLMNRNQWPTKYRLGGSFKSKRDDYKDGIVDDVPKYNLVAMVDSYRTVKISTKGGPNTGTIRRVHTSQWGQQCPANTPENANIGLNNNMAEACIISNDLTTMEKDALDELISNLEQVDDGDLLIIDGNPIGYYAPGTYEQIRDARREGIINRGIGIARHHLWSTELTQGVPIIVIRTSHGRPLVPMFIIDQNVYNLNRILSLKDDVDMQYLLDEGYVEFVDAYEMVYNVLVAPWIYDVVQDGSTTKYTHAMIKPGHILSQASNCLSYIEHNPPARGTYGTQHIKQAIGRPFLYPEDRYDHESNYLNNPEPPLVITDTMRRILYPKYRPTVGIRDRDVGIGRNVNIVCMSYDGNNDDGIVVSQSMVDSGIFDGEHFSITTSDKSILPSSVEAYDWIINEETNREIRDDRGQGLPDPSFSAGIVVPYGDPYIVEIPDSTLSTLSPIDTYNGSSVYELVPGERYIKYGFYSALLIQYRDNKTGVITDAIIVPGTEPINVSGKTIISEEKGQVIHRLALVHVDNPIVNRISRQSPIPYDTLLNTYSTTAIDTRFINKDTGLMVSVPIPRTQLPGMNIPTRTGVPIALRPRRHIVRGDVATKIVKRRDGTPDAEVLDPKGDRDRFEITYGIVDGIERGSIIKLRSSMPIGPKPGNKYAALYAQKSVIARIAPDDEMPRARWFNTVSNRYEEMTFDIVFNPLSFPSRMTMGMEYEIFIAGTLRYLFSITIGSTTLGNIYNTDRDRFHMYMKDTYDVSIDIVDSLSDSTCFIYNNEEKYNICRDLRIRLGIPSDGLYDVYLKDPDTQVDTSILRDLPSHREWTRRVESPILCGTVYYVALRHLVDNKRRARGYVGRRDPMTLQPVKGRRRNGGANTGTMETDAYKAHGASAMLYERLSKVSDYKQFHKCTLCGGLVSKITTNNTYRCNDCTSVLKPNQIIDHETVNSWHLFRHYVRPLGIEINEHF